MREWAGMVATWLSGPGASVYAVPALHLIVSPRDVPRDAVDAQVEQLRRLLPGYALQVLLAHDSQADAEHTLDVGHLLALESLLEDPTSDVTSVVAINRQDLRASEVAVDVVYPTATALAAAGYAQARAERSSGGGNPYPSPFAPLEELGRSPGQLPLPTLTITDRYGRGGLGAVLEIGAGEGPAVEHLATALVYAKDGWVLNATITKNSHETERAIHRRRQVLATAFQQQLTTVRDYLTRYGYQLPTVEDLLDRIHLTERESAPAGVSTFTFALPEPNTSPTTARQALTAPPIGTQPLPNA
ncbi:hypothetical protein GUJ16_13865 [Enterococcus hirae]|nr:hypothetical protein [Enterococcus hirae]